MKLLLLWLACFMLVRSCPAAAPATPRDLAVQLRAMQSDLDSESSSAVLSGLPAEWDVATPERRYSISTAPLRLLLRTGQVPDAQAWLDQAARQLESFSAAPPVGAANARGTLDRILARSEFAGVRPPTAWDLFRERVIAWIAAQLRKFFEFAAQHPTGAQVLFWVLVAGAVGMLGTWLFRLWTRKAPLLKVAQPTPAAPPLHWEAWLRAAREAAGQGDSREGIRCVYWAAVARLQAEQVLPQDVTHTPREYLRLISQPLPFLKPLTALTAGLERFWYAGQAAKQDDFEASLKQLEALGCRLD